VRQHVARHRFWDNGHILSQSVANHKLLWYYIDNMTEKLPDAEIDFNPADYPERVSCKAMPSLNDKSAEVAITDASNEVVIAEVPLAALMLVPMPRLSENLPAIVRQPFEEGVGLGIISCRIESRQEDEAVITLPTVTGPMPITIPTRIIVRKVN
jgi:hypothetical protein